MHGPSRRRRRRHRLLRKLQRVQRSPFAAAPESALVGIWDDCIEDKRMAALMRAAQADWAHQGGNRSVAKSSWMPRDATPRSPLEALALAVLRSHVTEGVDAVEGAEYWVQIRQGKTVGLGLHFDKDERAHAESDEWRHPSLATATYLTDAGAPLVVFDTASSGEGAVERGWLVSPRRGRHVAFLGDRLHGVPGELAPQNDTSQRVSILVNLWDRQPAGVSRAAGGGTSEPFDVDDDLWNVGYDEDGDILAVCGAACRVPPERVRVDPGQSSQQSASATLQLAPRSWNPSKMTTPHSAGLIYLAEHRDGDTGPIPLEAWRHVAEGPAAALELRYY